MQSMLVVTDIAKSLGYSNTSDAISRHCKQKGVVKHDPLTSNDTQNIRTTGGDQNLSIINEPCLYSDANSIDIRIQSEIIVNMRNY